MWRRLHISANSFEDYGYPVRVSVVTYWPKMPEVIDFIIETSERLGLKLHTHHRLRTRPGIKAHTFLFERDEMPLRGFRPNATPESRHDERYFPNRYLLGSVLADELYRRTIHLSVDYAVTFGDLALYGPKLIVTDVDSTLITTEVIEMIAAAAGTKDRVREMTSSAMRGEVDFAQSLKDRVATLQGVPTDVFTRIAEEITFTDGALALINTAHRHGARFGVVSGGFHEVVDILARDAHIDYVLANRL
ncbi:MAG: HAD-IB family phosphatase, partial [Arcanobacterium sp.]|nr:HAD-IB family phosphatase [Arcanobacterium sp.]